MPSQITGAVYQFGDFQLDCGRFELLRNGRSPRVERKPMELLILLVSRDGQPVTRAEIAQHLWSSDVFVDTEHGINTAIRKLRQVLRDDSEQPRFVQTVSGMGYRFVATIGAVSPQLDDKTSSIVSKDTLGVSDDAGRVSGPGAANVAQEAFTSDEDSIASLSQRFLLGLVFVVLVLVIAWLLRPALPLPQSTATTQLTNDGVLKVYALEGGRVPIVTDGSRIYFQDVFSGTGVLKQVSTEGGETVPVDVPIQFGDLADISADGHELLVDVAPEGSDGYSGGGFQLWRLLIPGMQPRRIGDLKIDWMAATLSPDGKVLYYGSRFAMFAAQSDGSHPRRILSTNSNPFWVRISPDGSLIRFRAWNDNDHADSLWEAHTDGSQLRQLYPGFSNGDSVCCGNWTADGRYFVFESTHGGTSTLWIVREAGDPWRRVSHEPAQLTHGEIGVESPLPSKDGKKIFYIGVIRRDEVMRYDIKTHGLAPFQHGLSALGFSFTKDGQRMAYVSYPEKVLWQSRIDGTERHQLTIPPMTVDSPRWSPDGSQIAFRGTPPGKPGQIFVIAAGGGVPQQVTSGEVESGDPTWSSDGNSLAYSGPWAAKSTNIPLHLVNLRTHEKTVVPDSEGYFSPRWSPDGRHLLAVPLGRHELMMYDFTLRRWSRLALAGTLPGYPNWTADGECVYFASGGPKGAEEFRICLRDHKIRYIADLAQIGPQSLETNWWTGLAPDGSVLVARDTSSEEIYALDVRLP